MISGCDHRRTRRKVQLSCLYRSVSPSQAKYLPAEEQSRAILTVFSNVKTGSSPQAEDVVTPRHGYYHAGKDSLAARPLAFAKRRGVVLIPSIIQTSLPSIFLPKTTSRGCHAEGFR